MQRLFKLNGVVSALQQFFVLSVLTADGGEGEDGGSAIHSLTKLLAEKWRWVGGKMALGWRQNGVG